MGGKIDCDEFWLIIMISLCKSDFAAPIVERIVNKDCEELMMCLSF